MIATRRLLSLSLTLAMLGAGGLAAWALSAGGEAARTVRSLPSPMTVTPTPENLNAIPGIEAAAEAVRASDPEVAALIAAALRADTEAVLAAAPSSGRICDELVVRGVSDCERMSLPAGTAITLYSLSAESAPGYQLDEQVARATVGYLLDGRNLASI